MACKVLWESLLKVLNFLLAITGLAMVGYGLYLLIEWTKISSGGGGGGGDDDNDPISPDPMSPVSGDAEFLKLGRPMLAAVALSNDLFDKLPKAWYCYLFTKFMIYDCVTLISSSNFGVYCIECMLVHHTWAI